MAEAPFANLEAEKAFLAGIASQSELESPAFAQRLLEESLVVPDRLTSPAHRDVLEAMSALLAQGQPADAIALRVKLDGKPAVAAAGGVAWVTELLGEPPAHTLIPELANAIRAAALRRRLVSIGRDFIAKASDPEADPAATLLGATRELAGISLSRRSVRSLADVMFEAIDEMEARAAGTGSIPPMTGLGELDAITGGLPSTLIVVGAMPGVGKSAFFASVAQNIARSGRTVALFSLEDEALWLAWRLWSGESGIPQFILRHRALAGCQRQQAADGVARINAYANRVLVDDRGALTPKELVQTARDLVVNRGAGAILVDHLGELRFEGRHRERFDLEVAEGLSDLREIAKRHHVPVVVACHLRRREGLKPDTEPSLTDLANSSACERQARVVLGLSRAPDSETLRITVLKNTNGRAGKSVDVRFVGAVAMVRDCERAAAPDFYGSGPPEEEGPADE